MIAAWFSISSCGPHTPGYLMWLQVFPISADDRLSLKLPVFCVVIYKYMCVCIFSLSWIISQNSKHLMFSFLTTFSSIYSHIIPLNLIR